MANFYKWLNLQLFAGEGAGEGGGEGASTGETAVDAGQQRLLELGVPMEKLKRRANRYSAKAPEAPKAENAEAQVAAAESNTPTEENTEEKPSANMNWDEFMANPENNKKMQSIVQSRLKSAKAAEENLSKLTPALELLARKHGIDPANIDYDALAKKISDDGSYYEDKALEMGVSVETAKQIDQQERETARQQAMEARTLEQQAFEAHILKLEQQGEAMKKVFPNFDLRTELQIPAFARMTSPNIGISVEDAYYAVHRNEIQSAAMQKTAQVTAKKLSNAIQAGSRRPDESGSSSQAPSVSTFNYAKADPGQRTAFKKALREAWARGEKVYPGQMK